MTVFRYLGTALVVVFVDYLLVLTDCIIAGRVVGETALAAMNLLMPVFSVVTFFTWLLASGISTPYQLAARRRDERRSAEIAFQGLTAAILLAFLLCAAVHCSKDAYLAFMGLNAEVTGYFNKYLTRGIPPSYRYSPSA